MGGGKEYEVGAKGVLTAMYRTQMTHLRKKPGFSIQQPPRP